MDRKLIDYLPPVLREVSDFQEINTANEPEISLAWDALALVLANQFLDSATEWGVRSWEQDAGICPKDTDTLETRKIRLKAKWGMQPPYTLPWLRNWLTSICGPTGYDAEVDAYTITVKLDATTLPDADQLSDEILALLMAIRPSNIRIGSNLHSTSEPITGTLYLRAVGTSGSETGLPVWEQEHNFTQTIHLVAVGGAMSVTELPPA